MVNHYEVSSDNHTYLCDAGQSLYTGRQVHYAISPLAIDLLIDHLFMACRFCDL